MGAASLSATWSRMCNAINFPGYRGVADDGCKQTASTMTSCECAAQRNTERELGRVPLDCFGTAVGWGTHCCATIIAARVLASCVLRKGNAWDGAKQRNIHRGLCAAS